MVRELTLRISLDRGRYIGGLGGAATLLRRMGAERIVGGIPDGGVLDGIALGLVLLTGGASEIIEPGDTGGELTFQKFDDDWHRGVAI